MTSKIHIYLSRISPNDHLLCLVASAFVSSESEKNTKHEHLYQFVKTNFA